MQFFLLSRSYRYIHNWLQAIVERRWWYVIIVALALLWTIKDDLSCKYREPSRFTKMALYFGNINCPGYENYTREGRQRLREKFKREPLMPMVKEIRKQKHRKMTTTKNFNYTLINNRQ